MLDYDLEISNKEITDSLEYISFLNKQTLREISYTLHIDRIESTTFCPDNNFENTYSNDDDTVQDYWIDRTNNDNMQELPLNNGVLI